MWVRHMMRHQRTPVFHQMRGVSCGGSHRSQVQDIPHVETFHPFPGGLRGSEWKHRGAGWGEGCGVEAQLSVRQLPSDSTCAYF